MEENKKKHPGLWHNISTLRSFIRESLFVEMRKYAFLAPPDALNKFENDIIGKTLIFFDTETTGFKPSKYKGGSGQIIEIAAVAIPIDSLDTVPDFNSAGTFHFKIGLNPRNVDRFELAKLDREVSGEREKGYEPDPLPDILKMTGFFENVPVVIRNNECDVLSEFSQFISSYPNAILVAHNAAFDMKFVNTRLAACKQSALQNETFDTLKFFDFYLRPTADGVKKLIGTETNNPLLNQVKVSLKLGDVTKLFNLPMGKAHMALEDVKMTVRALYRAYKFLKVFYDNFSALIENAPDDQKAELQNLYDSILKGSYEARTNYLGDRDLRSTNPKVVASAEKKAQKSMAAKRKKRKQFRAKTSSGRGSQLF